MSSNYRDYESEAHALVQSVLTSTIEKILQESSSNVKENKCAVEWPKGEGFTVEKGTAAIEQLVKVKIVILTLMKHFHISYDKAFPRAGQWERAGSIVLIF